MNYQIEHKVGQFSQWFQGQVVQMEPRYFRAFLNYMNQKDKKWKWDSSNRQIRRVHGVKATYRFDGIITKILPRI